jgi:hypothetical protein
MFHTFVVRNLAVVRYAMTKGTTCSLIVITADQEQGDMQRYVITVIGVPSLTTSFTSESLQVRKRSPVYI